MWPTSMPRFIIRFPLPSGEGLPMRSLGSSFWSNVSTFAANELSSEIEKYIKDKTALI